MLLENLNENDIVVFSDGSCSKAITYCVNDLSTIISIIFDDKVVGRHGYAKKFCWTYRMDGSLYTCACDTNNIVKVIYTRES